MINKQKVIKAAIIMKSMLKNNVKDWKVVNVDEGSKCKKKTRLS